MQQEAYTENFENLTNAELANYWCHLYDFVVLYSASSFTNYLLPGQCDGNDKGFVIGYPGFIAEDKFIEDYANNSSNLTDDAKALHKYVHDQSGGFERKVVSIGSMQVNKKGLITHRCPTLRGTSGGILCQIDNIQGGMPTFVGIHIGGCTSMENNFAVPICQAEFGLELVYHLCKHNVDVLKAHAAQFRPIVQNNCALFMKHCKEVFTILDISTNKEHARPRDDDDSPPAKRQKLMSKDQQIIPLANPSEK